MAFDDLDIAGSWPELAGKTLNGLIVQESWFEGERDDEANVVWIEADGEWHRLYFDNDAVHWRIARRGPDMENTGDADFPKVDLGTAQDVVGQTVVACDGDWIDESSRVTLRLESGVAITFRNRFDTTTILVDQAAATS